MKITRKMLMWITAGLGISLILWALIRHFTGFYLDETIERHIMNGVILAALGLFLYNRKMVKDEKQAKEAEEEAKHRAEEEPEEEVHQENDDHLPHWERSKKRISNLKKSDTNSIGIEVNADIASQGSGQKNGNSI